MFRIFTRQQPRLARFLFGGGSNNGKRCLTCSALQHGVTMESSISAWPPTNSNTSRFLAARFFPASSARYFSTDDRLKKLPVKILYASQGGTAQIFAAQLSEALEEVDTQVEILGLHEGPSDQILQPGEALYVFCASTAGVGEPPDNARKFSAWLMEQPGGKKMEGVEYAVFALGNQKAHPNHYNMFGKTIDKRMEELGATRVFPIGLGDDGECIEDDFDNWMESFLNKIYHGKGEDDAASGEAPQADEVPKTSSPAQVEQLEDPELRETECPVAKNGTRLVSSKYPLLNLKDSGTDVIRPDLFDLHTPFYMENSTQMHVLHNRPLNPNAAENGMYELKLSIDPKVEYEAGDHLMVYPRNSQAMLEGYLAVLDVAPHTRIEPSRDDPAKIDKYPYPHPTGITLSETLSHCVDLSATPSPAFARLILRRKNLDYKNEIAGPRRTVLDLIADAPRKLTLEELLYNLPPIKPRYYSIASSSKVHPNNIYLTYRPVQYVNTRGVLRAGLTTSYMLNLVGAEDGETQDLTCSNLVACLNPNPTFRLPEDQRTPVLMIAGGCGIAPIRAFLEERMQRSTEGPFGEGYLFLGFRTPDDAPYKDLIRQAFKCGALSNVHVTYGAGCTGAASSLQGDDVTIHSSCGLVSESLAEHSDELYSFFERGGQTFICGGARNFGVAVENQVHALLEKHGDLSSEEATKYLQKLLADGRFHEDLSD